MMYGVLSTDVLHHLPDLSTAQLSVSTQNAYLPNIQRIFAVNNESRVLVLF